MLWPASKVYFIAESNTIPIFRIWISCKHWLCKLYLIFLHKGDCQLRWQAKHLWYCNSPIALRNVASEASTFASNPNCIHVRLRPSNSSFSRIFSLSRTCSKVILFWPMRVFSRVGSFFNVRGLLDRSILYPVACETPLARKTASFLPLMPSLLRKSIAPSILAFTGVGFWYWSQVTSVIGVVGSCGSILW